MVSIATVFFGLPISVAPPFPFLRREDAADLLRPEPDHVGVHAEAPEDVLLPFRDGMVEPVDAVVPTAHLYLLQLPYRRGDRRVVRLRRIVPECIPDVGVEPAADDERDELDEDLRGGALIGVDPHGPVPQVGFVPPEQLLVLIPGLVGLEGVLGRHLLAGDDAEVAAVAQLPLDHVLALLMHEKRPLIVIGEIEVLLETRTEDVACALEPVHAFPHGLELLLDHAVFRRLPLHGIVEVDVPRLLVVRIQPALDGGAVERMPVYVVVPHVLEGAPLLVYDRIHEGVHPLDHDDEVVAALLHGPDVGLGEVPPVQDERRVRIPVGAGLAEHELELAHIDDRARVLLVEQRDAVGPVVGDRVAEYGQALVILRMPVLDELKLAGLAVLVRGVVTYVDFLPVVARSVPVVEEPRRRILSHLLQQAGYLRVAVDRHILGEQGVGVCIIGVVLRGVVLGDDRVGRKVQKEPAVLGPEYLFDHLGEAEGPGDPLQDQERADPQAAAPEEGRLLLGKLMARKATEKVLVRVHETAVGLVLLADADPFGGVVLAVPVVLARAFEVDVFHPLHGDPDDMLLGYRDGGIEVHRGLLDKV